MGHEPVSPFRKMAAPEFVLRLDNVYDTDSVADDGLSTAHSDGVVAMEVNVDRLKMQVANDESKLDTVSTQLDAMRDTLGRNKTLPLSCPHPASWASPKQPCKRCATPCRAPSERSFACRRLRQARVVRKRAVTLQVRITSL